MQKMQALIFADGKLGVGLGHLSRCRALQAELESLEFRTSLLDSALLNAQTLNTNKRPQTSPLNPPVLKPTLNSDSAKPYQLIVIDSYVLSLDSYILATQYAEVCLFFDDTLRLDYPNGILLNNAPCANVAQYREKYPHHLLFLGSDYRLLQMPFLEALKKPPISLRQEVKNVLITLGGSDILGLNQPLITALQKAYPHLNLHCITKDSTILGAKLYRDLCAQEMVDLIRQMDLCICACGQSLGEILACGIPAIALEVVENQRENLKSFSHCVLSVPEAYLLPHTSICHQVLEHFCVLQSLKFRQTHQKCALEILTRPTKWRESLDVL
ncbi:hypothetical protein [Helicobacter rodentium]|uniref:hypothetical protein n=1 Tax=Helicobacter rodentium TaxID=59617 RepID=UPI0004791E53|nr:hypothetical protein [Helicobacter rodentium]